MIYWPVHIAVSFVLGAVIALLLVRLGFKPWLYLSVCSLVGGITGVLLGMLGI